MAKKRADGRYAVQFNINGKRYTVYGKSIKECREKEAQKRQEIAAGLYQTGENITVSAYFDRWLENREGTVKPSTLRTNKNLFATIKKIKIDKAGSEFGSLKLRKIEIQNVRDLQSKMNESKSTRTVNDSIALLKSVFNTAVEERIINYNPAAPVKSLKRTEEAARDTIHRALTREETAAFFEAVNNSSYKNLYVFLLNTGCRIGEAGALLRSDITAKGIQVSRTITRLEDHTYTIGEDTKTAAGKRYIPLSTEAKKAIEDQAIQERILHGDKITGIRQPIFRSPGGLLLNPSPINEDIARVCKRAGIERFTVHAFRDTFATRCVEAGMQPKTLQEIMGHTDISMTLGLYAHAMDETKEEQLKVVNFM